MKIIELLSESITRKMPGAPPGIKIMTPSEFAGVHEDEPTELDEADDELDDENKSSTIVPEKPVKIMRTPKDSDEPERMLNAPRKEFPDNELADYLKTTIDRTKTASQRYKMPYIHRSSAIRYYDEGGDRISLQTMRAEMSQRPKKLLKQNEKMEHSNGEKEQFYNVGFAALTGIALDEASGKFMIVNTCPGAGSCKIDCFARGGGKIQFAGPWRSDARRLTYLLNNPSGFKSQLITEINNKHARLKKAGIKMTVRWHDAGDFFSPEYVALAFSIARACPDVEFYTYTKTSDVILNRKPKNFIINWSEGAHPTQERKVKANDAQLKKTKNSRIVPPKLPDGTPIFSDLIVRDAEGKLKKSESGAWQISDMKNLKQRISDLYGNDVVPVKTILTYDEMMKIEPGDKPKYNVIIAPGEGDISAKRHDVVSTLLLKH